MSHTVGPWIVDKERPTYPQADRPLGYYIANLRTGGRIAQFFENCLVTSEEEALANANLFAAAPNMLLALRDLVAQVDALAARGLNYEPVDKKYLWAAREALAQAEGQ